MPICGNGLENEGVHGKAFWMGPFPDFQCSKSVTVCGKWLNYRLGSKFIGLSEPFLGIQAVLDAFKLLVNRFWDKQPCPIDEVLDETLGRSMSALYLRFGLTDLHLC